LSVLIQLAVIDLLKCENNIVVYDQDNEPRVVVQAEV
jgi:hypothetical protein